MVGPEIEARAWRVTAMSSAKLVSGIWTASALYCWVCSKATTLLQLEASTKLPWTRTTLSPTPDAELCSASCELELAGHASLHAAGLGGQYSITESYDPLEHYGEMLLEDLAADAAYSNE